MDPGAEYRISLDPSELQMEVIHGFLTRTYWSRGIPMKVLACAVKHSLVAGAYQAAGNQVGFARLVTDHATFGYLADVFVLEEHRGRGLATAMTKALLEVPEVKSFRRIILATRDAHGVYEKCGFQRIEDATPFMQILRRDIYPVD
jgi:GNAT superfamily N-acetyltransferase